MWIKILSWNYNVNLRFRIERRASITEVRSSRWIIRISSRENPFPVGFLVGNEIPDFNTKGTRARDRSRWDPYRWNRDSRGGLISVHLSATFRPRRFICAVPNVPTPLICLDPSDSLGIFYGLCHSPPVGHRLRRRSRICLSLSFTLSFHYFAIPSRTKR